MMNNLYINEGDMVWLENVSLPSATFAKFQPQSVDFLEITNPKALYPPSSHYLAIINRSILIFLCMLAPVIKHFIKICVICMCHKVLKSLLDLYNFFPEKWTVKKKC